jgi:predicted SprT family Zn-dependent metalloprotease
MEKMTLLQIREYALELMSIHNLDDWKFRFNKRKRSLGVCRFSVKRIELSLEFALEGQTKDIIDTVKHEVAHAITGPGHAHDDEWKANAIKLGCPPTACADGVSMPESGRGAKYIAVCVCGTPHYLYRRPKRMEGWYCKSVGKGFPLVWKQA